MTCSGRTLPTGSPRCSSPKSGPGPHPERLGGSDVELARPGVLDEA